MTIWEVRIEDMADFGAVLFDGLFLSEELARKTGAEELASYREDQDEEFRSSIMLTVIEREVFG